MDQKCKAHKPYRYNRLRRCLEELLMMLSGAAHHDRLLLSVVLKQNNGIIRK
jgi:hypothetical protein